MNIDRFFAVFIFSQIIRSGRSVNISIDARLLSTESLPSAKSLLSAKSTKSI